MLDRLHPAPPDQLFSLWSATYIDERTVGKRAIADKCINSKNTSHKDSLWQKSQTEMVMAAVVAVLQ